MSDIVQPLGTLANFTCSRVDDLPFGGTEVLLVALFFFYFAVCFCVTFMDVALKQTWPEKYLNPAVLARVQSIQQQFPSLLPKTTAPNADPAALEAATALKNAEYPPYDHVVAQESYICGRTVDEDLITMLCNNDAYSTVSSYCACTVRGYALLSTALNVVSAILAFLWIHNATVDPNASDTASKICLLGYVLLMLTGSIMTGPNGSAVARNANVAWWSNVPTRIWGGKSNPTFKLHDIGVVSFIALPCFAHMYILIVNGSTMPNYAAAWTGISAQLTGAILFGLSGYFKNKGLTPMQSSNCMIISEIICVFASFLAFAQWEFYATAACAGAVTAFNSALLSVAAAPFAFIAVKYTCAPASYPLPASLILMNQSMPVATVGPAPVLVFNSEVPNTDPTDVKACATDATAELPHFKLE